MARLLVLSSLAPGRRGVIASLGCEGIFARRLLHMGFVPGTVVEAVRRAPGGDPIAFRVRGAVIALRSRDARCVLITPEVAETEAPGAEKAEAAHEVPGAEKAEAAHEVPGAEKAEAALQAPCTRMAGEA